MPAQFKRPSLDGGVLRGREIFSRGFVQMNVHMIIMRNTPLEAEDACDGSWPSASNLAMALLIMGGGPQQKT